MAIIRFTPACEEIMKYILKIQGQKKIEKSVGQYSLSKVLSTIVLEHKKMKEGKK